MSKLPDKLVHFIPDGYFETTVDALESIPENTKGVILDLDGVLIEVDGEHSPPSLENNVKQEVYDKFIEVREKYPSCILTNRVRYDSFNEESLEDFFATEVVNLEDSKKPQAIVYEQALNYLQAEPDEVVMIGDSPYTDIYGANKAGLTTYQIKQDRGKYHFPENLTKRGEDLFQAFVRFLEGDK